MTYQKKELIQLKEGDGVGETPSGGCVARRMMKRSYDFIESKVEEDVDGDNEVGIVSHVYFFFHSQSFLVY